MSRVIIVIGQRSLTADKPEELFLLDEPVSAGHVYKSLLHGLPGEERLTSHHVPSPAGLRE